MIFTNLMEFVVKHSFIWLSTQAQNGNIVFQVEWGIGLNGVMVAMGVAVGVLSNNSFYHYVPAL